MKIKIKSDMNEYNIQINEEYANGIDLLEYIEKLIGGETQNEGKPQYFFRTTEGDGIGIYSSGVAYHVTNEGRVVREKGAKKLSHIVSAQYNKGRVFNKTHNFLDLKVGCTYVVFYDGLGGKKEKCYIKILGFDFPFCQQAEVLVVEIGKEPYKSFLQRDFFSGNALLYELFLDNSQI